MDQRELTPTNSPEQHPRAFSIFEFILGIGIGAAVAGTSVYLWQQTVWRPTVDRLNREYSELNEEYLAYKPPTIPTPASDSGTLDYGHGEQVRTDRKEFSRDLVGFSMPAIADNPLDISVYSYKDKAITNLRSDVTVSGTSAGVDVWRYDSPSGEKDIPEDFVTFYGYENYTLWASPVAVTMANTSDTYTAPDGKIWKYQYEYTPKSIGVVSLTTFVQPKKNETGKPLFIRLWYALGLGHQQADPEVSAAKIEAAKLVDTVVF